MDMYYPFFCHLEARQCPKYRTHVIGVFVLAMGTNAPVSSPVQLREQGLTLLQQVRGRYLSINYDVPALLMTYVRLLDQLGVMSKEMKTCKVRILSSVERCLTDYFVTELHLVTMSYAV